MHCSGYKMVVLTFVVILIVDCPKADEKKCMFDVLSGLYAHNLKGAIHYCEHFCLLQNLSLVIADTMLKKTQYSHV